MRLLCKKRSILNTNDFLKIILVQRYWLMSFSKCTITYEIHVLLKSSILTKWSQIIYCTVRLRSILPKSQFFSHRTVPGEVLVLLKISRRPCGVLLGHWGVSARPAFQHIVLKLLTMPCWSIKMPMLSYTKADRRPNDIWPAAKQGKLVKIRRVFLNRWNREGQYFLWP